MNMDKVVIFFFGVFIGIFLMVMVATMLTL